MRQPTSSPVSDITTSTMTLLTTSERVRPVSTADGAIGSDRKRSMMPFCTSSASPAPVVVAPKITVWAKIPAIRNSRYCCGSPPAIAPPKTYANSSTNMIGESVVKTSSSGTRRILMRLRLATTRPSVSVVAALMRSSPSSWPSASRSPSLAWPVRVRNTSSSVGRRSPTSSSATPASASRRSASASAPAPPGDRHDQRPRLARSTVGSPDARSASAARARLELVAVDARSARRARRRSAPSARSRCPGR